MLLANLLRSFAAALLLGAALMQPAAAGVAAPTATSRPPADNPAAHPSFTVQVTGRGRPLILIPGLTCPGAVWNETVAHYAARGYQCHVLSLAGFGGVPATSAPVGAPATGAASFLPAVRDELLAYLKAQRLERPAIIGHSLGGFLGLWLSTAQPDAIGPLIILDSLPFLAAIQNPALTAEAARPMAAGMRQQMQAGRMAPAQQRQMVAGMVADTARQRLLARWGQASDPARVAQAMYELYTTDLRADLGAIRQPALVLGAWAAYQPYGATLASTQAIFAAQYARLPRHQIEMSRAGRHFLMYDDAPWFFQRADAFLGTSYPARK